MEILRQGAYGTDVELLQTALKRAEYIDGEINKSFTGQIYKAVVSFQKNKGLVPDGIVGPSTWRVLRSYLTGYITWKVRSGDTLFNLSERFKTSVRAMVVANPGISAVNLYSGQEIKIPLDFDVVPTDIDFTYNLLTLCIEGLKARYPFMKTSVIGTSILGKKLFAISIGRGKNKIMYNASHHANEWITTIVLMKFIEDYLKDHSNLSIILNSNTIDMYERSTIYFVPMVNPDGVDLVTGAIPPGSDIYKKSEEMNYLNLPFPTGWKANIRGVDTNLNYPAGWEEAKKIKFEAGYIKQGPRDFVGEFPLSEPENRAMFDFSLKNNFNMTLSYHTQGQTIYWRYLHHLPARSYEIGKCFSDISTYLLEETPYESGHAGYKDWFIQDFNKPGYTIECGLGESPLPLSQFDKIYKDNLGILTSAALM